LVAKWGLLITVVCKIYTNSLLENFWMYFGLLNFKWKPKWQINLLMILMFVLCWKIPVRTAELLRLAARKNSKITWSQLSQDSKLCQRKRRKTFSLKLLYIYVNGSMAKTRSSLKWISKNAAKFTATSLSPKSKKRKWKPSLPNEFVTSLNHWLMQEKSLQTKLPPFQKFLEIGFKRGTTIPQSVQFPAENPQSFGTKAGCTFIKWCRSILLAN